MSIARSYIRPTKAEKARMDKISRIRCVACWDGIGVCGKTEVHHLTSGGKRRGHAYTVPMGIWHHRGIPLSGSNTAQMTWLYGPSLRLQSKEFKKTYGTDDQLLAKVNELLERV